MVLNIYIGILVFGAIFANAAPRNDDVVLSRLRRDNFGGFGGAQSYVHGGGSGVQWGGSGFVGGGGHVSGSRKHGHDGGFVAAGNSHDRLKASSVGQSLSSVGGNDFYNIDDGSRISSSKTSSSGSSKTSKIKTGTSFGGAGSSYNQDQYGISNVGKLNYAFNENLGYGGGHDFGHGAGFVKGTNVGLDISQISNVGGSHVSGGTGFFGGQTNTEIEQSETHQQSQSENFEAEQGHKINAGSQYHANKQQYGRDDVEIDHGESFVFGA